VRVHVLPWCAALALMALPLPADAQPTPRAAAATDAEAKAIFGRGVERFEAGDLHGAREAFERAYVAAPYPIVGYNLGLTLEALGDPVGARDVLSRVVAAPGTLRPDRIARARKAVADAETRIGIIAVRVDVASATVRAASKTPIPAPATLEVAAGEVSFEVAAEGHRPEYRVIKVNGGERRDIEIHLEPIATRLAQVRVRTALPDATLRIDGVAVARAPFVSTIAVEAGTHRVEVGRPGYATAAETLVLAAGGTAEVTLEPREDPAAIASGGGRLILHVSPPDASVLVDGARRDPTPQGIALAAGRHAVTLKRSGYDDAQTMITIAAGGRVDGVVSLVPTPETRAAEADAAASQRTVGWVIGGTGLAVAAAGGVILGVNAAGAGQLGEDRAAFDAFEGDFARCEGNPRDDLCTDADTDLIAREQQQTTLDVVGAIGIPVGLIAVGVGAFILLGAPDVAAPPEVEWGATLRPTLNIGRDATWIGVEGRLPSVF